MDERERLALKALRFNWAPTPDDVWRQPAFHVEELHKEALRAILDGVEDADRSADSSPVGVAVLGQRGSGKTHLLGSVRQHVQAAGGYFFLISLLEASAFWRGAALSILDGLNRETDERESQLRIFLRRLADLVGAPRAVRRAVTGEAELTRPALDAFVDLLRKHNRQVGVDCQDTARALVLEAAEKTADQDVGHEFLCANDELEPGQRAFWGMRRARRSAQEIVRDVSRLLALTGPTVIAVDQIDLLINQAAKSLDGETRLEWRAALLLEQIAGGLMALRETTRRTLSVVACLDESWALVKTQATDTVQDRFREAVQLRQIGSAELGRELIARRFAAPFADQGFVPPYPTWPVRPPAFAEAVQFTPRELLRTIDAHVRECLRDSSVREMHRLVHGPSAGPAPDVVERTSDGELAGFDARYAALRAAADPGPAYDAATEDAVVPALLEAGLTAWIGARHDGGLFGLDPQPGTKPALHGRLRHSLDEQTEDEAHWAFRAVSARHPVAALNRIRNASTAAGLTEGVAKRKLFFLRNEPWSGGARTTEVIETFSRAGGRTLAFPPTDVAALMALRELLRERGYETLRPWFAARRPADEISFLREALAGAGSLPAAVPPSAAAPSPTSAPGGDAGGSEVPAASDRVTPGGISAAEARPTAGRAGAPGSMSAEGAPGWGRVPAAGPPSAEGAPGSGRASAAGSMPAEGVPAWGRVAAPGSASAEGAPGSGRGPAAGSMPAERVPAWGRVAAPGSTSAEDARGSGRAPAPGSMPTEGSPASGRGAAAGAMSAADVAASGRGPVSAGEGVSWANRHSAPGVRPAGDAAPASDRFAAPSATPAWRGETHTSTTPEGTSAAGEAVPAPVVMLPTARAVGVRQDGPDRLTLGQSVQNGRPVGIDLAALRRHAAIFAGSGSGKTVLIRRLVEECALRGVSAIVLDPNNDLARLGDPWPERPAQWDDIDAARAAAYHRQTDVVVWTPRRSSGRPLSFRPLPDFAAIADDPDALASGIDAAMASLAPRVNVDGTSTKARIGNAVLREALTAYASIDRPGRNGDLRDFAAYLTGLPAQVSELDNAPRIANEIGQLLRATIVSDPLFGGDGAPLDPGELLTPADGWRARISVISFVGLPDDAQRQSFVNQLQLALFAWIKRNPATDRPLGGLLVMDEAQTLAPSGAMTACTQSTLALASQARKYGLGLVFATQAPKGLHNRIPGNAATQLFGLLNSPTQIAAAKEMARAKGSDIADVARLRPGHFYAAVDGGTFAKLRAPLCLSHHPSSPLTTEEVLDRARRD
ncbi:helicase HerA domain-containing protein [Asanoa siamensis]|uniref:AAA+ ATPase domain-containing protein n=1 Tax=Asanoa siamensis TaxID=926357 RepID=A0ABQ4D0A3_9ACTN|nr:DUF87 domain-containing protein [Asanoa siamensis]GIF76979.1 hypothetical protein Asi02nite_64970 [Asanoa siamensis]